MNSMSFLPGLFVAAIAAGAAGKFDVVDDDEVIITHIYILITPMSPFTDKYIPVGLVDGVGTGENGGGFSLLSSLQSRCLPHHSTKLYSLGEGLGAQTLDLS